MLQFESGTELSASLFDGMEVPAEQVLFFDIETTGLSASGSYVYLIGAAFLSGGTVFLHQWFMDDVAQEKELIRTFLEFADRYRLLVHYNGTAFDLPFLQKKCQRHCLPDILSGKQSLDIYKKLMPCKPLLGLKDMKQKSLEQKMGLFRDDPFSGGDLIPVYTEFIGRYRYEQLTGKNTRPSDENRIDFHDTGLKSMPESPAKALLSVLLLHNREDLTGLLTIAELLELPRVMDGSFSISFPADKTADACDTLTFHLLPQSKAFCRIFSALFQESLCRPVSVIPDGCAAAPLVTLSCTPEALILECPVLSGTLRYFFEDYRSYYYLPVEDCAMHKSVAEFVDKNYRQKATRNNCYQKKTGRFLFQPQECFTPFFKNSYKDSCSCFEYTDAIFTDPAGLKKWLVAVLTWLLTPTKS